MRTFFVTFNRRIGAPYETIQVQALNMKDAELVTYELMGNVRIVSVRG